MLVFTMFKVNDIDSEIALFSPEKSPVFSVPISRKNFSTRTFAHTYGLGSPLSAGFLNINYGNEIENHKNDNIDLTTASRKRMQIQSLRVKKIRKY